MPEGSDSEFTWEDFRARYAELADVVGNLCHRALTFASKRLGGRFPRAEAPADADRAVLAEISRARDEAGGHLLRFRFRQALSRVMELARAGNRHFDEREPWKTRRSDPADCEAAIAASLGVVRGLAALIDPFLPEAASRLRASLGKAAPAAGAGSWDAAGTGDLPSGAELGEAQVLFPKLDEDEFAALVRRATGADA
jgi:methionyl-tRNA synthetase